MIAVWWFFPGCVFASPFYPKDQAPHPSFGSNMWLQQHGQLSAPRTWAFGLVGSRNQRWRPPSGQGISGKIKKHQPRFVTTEVLDASKSGTREACRFPHPATEIYRHACGLGFSNDDCKAVCVATGCNGKETDYASKAGQQPVDALTITNNALPF